MGWGGASIIIRIQYNRVNRKSKGKMGLEAKNLGQMAHFRCVPNGAFPTLSLGGEHHRRAALGFSSGAAAGLFLRDDQPGRGRSRAATIKSRTMLAS